MTSLLKEPLLKGPGWTGRAFVSFAPAHGRHDATVIASTQPGVVSLPALRVACQVGDGPFSCPVRQPSLRGLQGPGGKVQRSGFARLAA